jgi:anti-anti-sigma factor
MSTTSLRPTDSFSAFEADGDAVPVVRAGTYLNKISGEQLERACLEHLTRGARALVIDFRDTDLVNSIGVANLLGVIDAAEARRARLVFCHVTGQTAELFDLLGLTRLVTLASDEEAARAMLRQNSL